MREAGGLVTDFTGGHNHLLSGNIVAGNPRVVKAMLSTLRDELSEALKRCALVKAGITAGPDVAGFPDAFRATFFVATPRRHCFFH